MNDKREIFIITAPDNTLDDIISEWQNYIEYKSTEEAVTAFEEDQDEDNEDRLYQLNYIVCQLNVELIKPPVSKS